MVRLRRAESSETVKFGGIGDRGWFDAFLVAQHSVANENHRRLRILARNLSENPGRVFREEDSLIPSFRGQSSTVQTGARTSRLIGGRKTLEGAMPLFRVRFLKTCL